MGVWLGVLHGCVSISVCFSHCTAVLYGWACVWQLMLLVKDSKTGSGLCVAETVHRRACLAASAPLLNPFNLIRAMLPFSPHPHPPPHLPHYSINSSGKYISQILLLPLSKQRLSCCLPVVYLLPLVLGWVCAAVMCLAFSERCSVLQPTVPGKAWSPHHLSQPFVSFTLHCVKTNFDNRGLNLDRYFKHLV